MNTRIAIPLTTLLIVTATAIGENPDTPDPSNPRVTPVVRAYRRVRPAVVNITAEKLVTAHFGPGKDLFSDIFPKAFGRRVPVRSLGSGFLIHPDGYLVTNAHVIRRAQKVSVSLHGEDAPRPARLISADPACDLAVLKIDPGEARELPYLPLGRSDDLMVGEPVIAIGNPMGYANTLTTGVISGVNRTLEFDGRVPFGGLIQTDTPINPGNSGGPLLNIRGELIGINTAIRADAQNIGFAVPVDALARELGNLLDFEQINRVVFGAVVRQEHSETGDKLIVSTVRPDTPAAEGLRAGDEIVALNGREIHQVPGFTCGMLSAEAGTAVRLGCVRDGERITVEVPVVAKPKPDGRALARRLFGMTVRTVTPDLAERLRLPADRGLLIVGVDEGKPAHKLGLHLKDILFQVGKYYVADLEDLGVVLENVGSGQVVRIGIIRGRRAVWLPVRTADDSPKTSPDAPAEKHGKKARP
ncbi:MAG: trypsin-like peptidase domain-containing protein [Phycisphaerae bacterium]|nr:trypsin-like peptidase domain-containing protein [Phycisphaerae bacterium]